MSQDLEQAINMARQRVLSGKVLTLDEQRDLLAQLRSNRFSAAEAGSAARTKRTASSKAKTGISDEDLDAQLGDLGL